MAYDGETAGPLALPAWKEWAGTACAAALALLFVVAGVWKLSDPLATEVRMVQALVPASLALAVALAAGITEVWAGVLILVPRWRRWGAWLCALMLVAFMVYFAVFYNALRGADCSCFPWLQRVVGPGFFISDGLMLAAAVVALLWSRRSESARQALVALGAIVVFAGVTYGVTVARQTTVQAPAEITVDGHAFALRQGRVFLYFFDPQCMHCFARAQELSRLKWKNVKLVSVATTQPQWGAGFLRDTGFQTSLSSDVQLLRKSFQFGDPPYGVALESGRQMEAFTFVKDGEAEQVLRRLGWAD